MKKIRVAFNGFGRIGRLVYRYAANMPGMEIVAVNDLVPADNLLYLLRYDTMHGGFGSSGSATDDSFTVDGKTTMCLSERDPANLPWGYLGGDDVL